MGVLSDILQYKEYQDGIGRQNMASVGQAVDTFNQLRQQGIQNKLSGLQIGGNLAASGIGLGENGQLVRDQSLMNPLQMLLQKEQLAANAITAGDTPLYQALMKGGQGGNGQPSAPQGQPNTVASMLPQYIQGTGSMANAATKVAQASNTSNISQDNQDAMAQAQAAGGNQAMVSGGSINPVSGAVTQNYTVPAAKAAEAGAGVMGTAQADAAKGTARDIANLGMIASESRNLMNYYDKADAEGLAGSKLNAFLADQAINPLTKETGQLAAPRGAAGAAGFQSAQNAFITRLEPVFQEQFGKDASSRILQSLIEMGQKEVGDLHNPRDVVAGKIGSTLNSVYRMLKGGVDYKALLNTTPEQILSGSDKYVNNLAKRVWENAQSIKLSPDEEASLNNIIKYATDKNSPMFQPGQTMKRGNITYTRQKDGTWLPQS